jgi:FKBP-type peptidyl-prolyl cis-trans isomerase
MKKGEQIRLYIHSDLAYRKSGPFLPNSLLIFEVETVELGQANSQAIKIFT